MTNTSPYPVTGDQEADGHRVKRMKTALLAISDINPSFNSQEQPTLPLSAIRTENIDGGRTTSTQIEDLPNTSIMDTSSSQPNSSNVQESKDASHKTMSDSNISPSHSQRGSGATADASPPKDSIDFSSAPSDPVELAIWVAKQIRQFEVPIVPGPEVESEPKDFRRSSLSHAPGVQIRHKSDEGADATVIAERDKQRDENRKRKQNWRGNHLERNKDNDLRCRVNSRAKKIYGITPSIEKTKWMEEEFIKRRERREQRESRERGFQGFTFEANLGTKLFAKGTAVSSETNAAGTLFINTLQGVRNTSIQNSNREAAAALKSALEDSATNSRPFIEALRTLGASPEIIRAINAALKDYPETTTNDPQSSSASPASLTSGWTAFKAREDANTALGSSGIRGGMAGSYTIDPQCEQNDDVIKALEAATNILHKIAEGNSDTYVTPYANPPPNGGPTGTALPEDGSTQVLSDTATSNQSPVRCTLDTSDIDDFLKLAAGGSVSDEDEEPLSDVQENISPAGGQTPIPQLDGDVSAMLERIIGELMAERDANQSPGYFENRPGLSINPPRKTSIHGSSTAKEQAAALKRLLDHAGVSINTIISAKQSIATSQLYAHLSSRANRFPTSGGGINPSHASAYGTTAQMTQRMLARPRTSTEVLQTASLPSRGNILGPPVRARNAAEAKKVQEYGFPPLPGSRPGQKRKR